MSEKINNYVRANLLKLIIILLLVFSLYRQSVIRDEVDSLTSTCYDIADDVEKIKDKLNIY